MLASIIYHLFPHMMMWQLQLCRRVRVAEFMGDGLSSLQCNIRWCNYLEPLQRWLTRRNWQPKEVKRLLELVPQHLIPSQWSTQRNAMTQESTGWTTIGEELGRAPMDCSSKYKSIHNNKLKKGPFTAEEDALIRQRVGEWGDKGNGLWAALEKEMGRVGSRINKRSIVLHDCNNMHWTDEMDARLIEGVAKYKADGWARVAEFMGDGLSAQQCCDRWSKYLEPLQRGLKRSNWQPDEVKRLLELVHPTPKQWSKRWKTECTDWKTIGMELGRAPLDCSSKYNLIQSGQMKKGPFTAEEDALIYQRVEEWGIRGMDCGQHWRRRWAGRED